MCLAGEKKKTTKPATGTPSPKLNGQSQPFLLQAGSVPPSVVSSTLYLYILFRYGLVYYSFVASARLMSNPLCCVSQCFSSGCIYFITLSTLVLNKFFFPHYPKKVKWTLVKSALRAPVLFTSLLTPLWSVLFCKLIKSLCFTRNSFHSYCMHSILQLSKQRASFWIKWMVIILVWTKGATWTFQYYIYTVCNASEEHKESTNVILLVFFCKPKQEKQAVRHLLMHVIIVSYWRLLINQYLLSFLFYYIWICSVALCSVLF